MRLEPEVTMITSNNPTHTTHPIPNPDDPRPFKYACNSPDCDYVSRFRCNLVRHCQRNFHYSRELIRTSKGTNAFLERMRKQMEARGDNLEEEEEPNNVVIQHHLNQYEEEEDLDDDEPIEVDPSQMEVPEDEFASASEEEDVKVESVQVSSNEDTNDAEVEDEQVAKGSAHGEEEDINAFCNFDLRSLLKGEESASGEEDEVASSHDESERPPLDRRTY